MMQDRNFLLDKIDLLSPRDIPLEIALLLGILGLIIFMWDFFERISKKLTKDSGLSENSKLISLRGSSFLPSKRYFSRSLALTSQPDALVIEDDKLIPVDFKPTSEKVRNRHVLPLLLHMKLMQEVDGTRPPYGIIILGEQRRRVKIKNTNEKQNWLDSIIEEMRSIEDGVPAAPLPAPFKCRQCNVRNDCKHSVGACD